MNFQRTNSKISLLEDYYSHFNEDTRLKTRHGKVEFLTNIKYIEKYLNNDKSKNILDIGAGTGAYSVYFDNKGYDVTAVELVEHNIEVFKKKGSNAKIYQGNALDLSMVKDDTFAITLLFGPMYHLLSSEEKMQALKEAKRVTKKDGIIFVSYYMNEYAILSYGFIKHNIINSIKEERVDNSFHIINKTNDLYSMVRLEDINKFNKHLALKRIKIIASDGASDYIRVTLNQMSEEEFDIFLKYHFSICERKDLLGASSHVLDIIKKVN